MDIAFLLLGAALWALLALLVRGLAAIAPAREARA
jgi:hypothetical protein